MKLEHLDDELTEDFSVEEVQDENFVFKKNEIKEVFRLSDLLSEADREKLKNLY